MKKNSTKWIPLGNYSHSETDYITFARKNIKTGMMYFKTKRVNGSLISFDNRVLISGLIDVAEQWSKLIKLKVGEGE